MTLRIALPVAALAAAALSLGACATLQRGPVGNAAVPEPAKAVELDRYLGRWYELARYEAGFQRGCEASTADYSLREDGLIRVINSCRQDAVDGPLRTVDGKARIVEGSGNAKLKVSFVGPFYFGTYWVLDRADDYSWSIVGEPSGRYLWILSRDPRPPAAVREALWQRVSDLGYDLSLLRETRH
ncbi:MAG: lipocalin family protein [Brevundimonas sp.]|uniref:lipocalin family protein n=1 Tax=Brevundimonas sp. TaxID=1871086 RepID=UPI0027348B76|nr:lipocalin family protein [Brevundimonas sp.]MDP3377665.1 lipocalin family protein [Brevundimonas sp.]